VFAVLILIILGGIIVGIDGDEIHRRNHPLSQSHVEEELVPCTSVPVLLSVDQFCTGVGGGGGCSVHVLISEG